MNIIEIKNIATKYLFENISFFYDVQTFVEGLHHCHFPNVAVFNLLKNLYIIGNP